jgi:hypothetical protein
MLFTIKNVFVVSFSIKIGELFGVGWGVVCVLSAWIGAKYYYFTEINISPIHEVEPWHL